MAIFPNVILEPTLQINDKTRLDATKSFISKTEAAITLVEIEPFSGSGFVTVTGTSSKDWFLDWQYSSVGAKVVTVRITTNAAPVTTTGTITVVSVVDDNLFSSDQDLVAIEDEVLKYVPAGRNTFLNVHRKAQSIILSELDERGITNSEGLSRITKDQITEIEDFNKWSTYMVLWLIYTNLSNSVDDKFNQKATFFKQRMDFHRERSFLRIDMNSDGTADVGEFQGVRTARMIRA